MSNLSNRWINRFYNTINKSSETQCDSSFSAAIENEKKCKNSDHATEGFCCHLVGIARERESGF